MQEAEASAAAAADARTETLWQNEDPE
jgi:hypothetical protein